jgi:hypothetical protein
MAYIALQRLDQMMAHRPTLDCQFLAATRTLKQNRLKLATIAQTDLNNNQESQPKKQKSNGMTTSCCWHWPCSSPQQI